MATYPNAIPDLEALCYANPLGAQKYLDLLAELQAALDALGINPQGALGTLSARLAEIDAKTTALANFGLRNLRVTNNATTPATKIDVVCESLGIEGAIANNVALTVDLTVTGKNGTAFPRTASTWYFLWVGLNPGTGEVCGLFDNDATRTGLDLSHASLAGFSKWRRIGARRTGTAPAAATDFSRLTQHGDYAVFDGTQVTGFHTAAAATWNPKDLSTAVPSTSRLALVQFIAGGATAGYTLAIRPVGTTTVEIGLMKIAASVTAYNQHWVTLDAAATFEWKSDLAVSPAQIITHCLGYRDAI